jgi:hypothetical protein
MMLPSLSILARWWRAMEAIRRGKRERSRGTLVSISFSSRMYWSGTSSTGTLWSLAHLQTVHRCIDCHNLLHRGRSESLYITSRLLLAHQWAQ